MSKENAGRAIPLGRIRDLADSGADSLIGFLADQLSLLATPDGEAETGLNYGEIACLASQAEKVLNAHVDYLISLQKPVSMQSGAFHWAPWQEDGQGRTRRPTRAEVKEASGEPDLLFDAIENDRRVIGNGIQLFAAFGLLTCERALAAEELGNFEVVENMLTAAVALLSHSTFLSGCFAGQKVEADAFAALRRLGGLRRQEKSEARMVKGQTHEAWKQWQRDRTRYANDPEFRASITVKNGGVPADSTLRKWIAEWRDELVRSQLAEADPAS